MNLTCPECKNRIDLSGYPNLAKDEVVECDHCGISLMVSAIGDDGSVETEIMDEAK